MRTGSKRAARQGPAVRAPKVLVALIAAILTAVLSSRTAPAQAGFQIVWVVIGEAASMDDGRVARVGRQLFQASDLLEMTLKNTQVESVDIDPVIIEIGLGGQLCLSALSIRAFGSDRRPVGGAPLSISIRQDHKENLAMRRSRKDICMRPASSGEYPIRLTSLIPAADGTMRGAQVFLRAKDPSPAGAARENRLM